MPQQATADSSAQATSNSQATSPDGQVHAPTIPLPTGGGTIRGIAFAAGNADGRYVTDDLTLYQPPVRAVSWYHTGAFLDRERILSQFAHRYFPKCLDDTTRTSVEQTFREAPLPEPDLASDGLTADEWRQALRACQGMLLRQKVSELDPDALHPTGGQRPLKLFLTVYHNAHIRMLQPRGENRHAVLLVTESEAISYHYELDLSAESPKPEPRIAHTLNPNIDKYGSALESVAVAYPRDEADEQPNFGNSR